MLNLDRSAFLFGSPDTEWSPSQWLPFHIYQWLPRFPRYSPNAFMLNNPNFYFFSVGWHSNYASIFPHTTKYRMLRAITRNKLDQVISILQKGFPIDNQIDPKYGFNSLHIAAIANHYPLIEILTLRGADIDKQDKLGDTPLMMAIANNNHEAIHSLLKNGSDLSIKNKYGLNALDKAKDKPNIQKFLLQYNEKKRKFPHFQLKLKLQKKLKNPFWDDIKNLKIYNNKVNQNPLARWQFDFTDYRTVSQLISQ